jgi:adenylate cyclase
MAGGRFRARVAAGARRLDRHPAVLGAARFARQRLPGDSRFGDPLSTGGEGARQAAGRRLTALTAQRPGALREAGLGALQVWQALSERQGRGRGERELAIVFTDLIDFSKWTLDAGDDAALELLRDVGEAIEPPVCDRGGEVVKRLGDGMMAVFEDPREAHAALLDARERLTRVRADGYVPRMRASMHVGRPRHLGGDYLGVDVNIAARMAEHAAADELLLSERTLELLGEDPSRASAKRRLKLKGAPKGLRVYSRDLSETRGR